MAPPSSTLFINGRFLTQRVTGVQRYAREVLLALDARLLDRDRWPIDVILLVPPGSEAPPLAHIEVRQVGRGSGHLWEQTSLAWHARRGFLLGFGATGPLLRLGHQAVTVHDAAVYAVPGAFSRRFRAWYRLCMTAMARANPVTMTVSEFSATELQRHLGMPRRRLRVTGAGWQHIRRTKPDPAIIETLGVEPGKYFLAVGSQSLHKNFAVIGRALRDLEDQGLDRSIRLVVVGGRDPRVFGREGPRDVGDILPAGYVSDASLRALYQHAAAFIFPSLYEGFGLPPLEAMAEGCPVICARSAALPEVCGDAALYFDPTDPGELAEAMMRIQDHRDTRSDLRRRAEAVLRRHSWSEVAAVHLEALASHLSGRLDARSATAAAR
jgi:glycosyltransferase involved in cell wall biosynthesis